MNAIASPTLPWAERPVVLGVDGSADNEAALQYAVAEARGLGVPVEMVHVVPDHLPVSPFVPLTVADLAGPGRRIVEDAEREATRIAPEVEATGWLHHGARAPRLAEAGSRGQVLVVGRDERPLVERLVRGDTATGAAARAHVPVVVVPPAWSAPEGRTAVVVGLRSPVGADALLTDAFAVAEHRGVPLVVVHTWWVPSGYDDLVVDQGLDAEWRQRAVDEVEGVLDPWRSKHPDVTVEVRVLHGEPATALVAAAEEAALVVIGRRRHGVPAALHLGGTARAVLRSASCPVRVVPPDLAGSEV